MTAGLPSGERTAERDHPDPAAELARGSLTMHVEVGGTLVYPVHGVAEVVGIDQRTVDGETSTYVTLRVRGEIRSDDLTIHVLRDRLGGLGVRHAASLEDAGEVLEVLAVRNPRLSSNWSRRFKSHQAKLRSGDVFECAEVVRNLSLRQREKPLGPAEKAMYQRARSSLVAELAVSWDIAEEVAAIEIDAALDR